MHLPTFGLKHVRAAAALALTLLLSACFDDPGKPAADDMTMGNPKAPVTMIEYASVACPHCARFNNNVFPAFKAKYIDTGKVFYISREMLTGDAPVAAAGFLLARCAGKDKYFAVTDALYHAQGEMFADGTTSQVRPVMMRIAQAAGVTPEQFDKCVSDDGALNAVKGRNDKYAKRDHIEGTPTFVIKGKAVLTGEVTAEQMDKVVADAMAGK